MQETLTIETIDLRVKSSEDGKHIFLENHKDGWVSHGPMGEKVMIPVEMIDSVCKILKRYQKEYKASKA